MPNILDRIVEAKRAEVAAAKAAVPLEQMRACAEQAEPPREFYAAILAAPPHGIHLVAEIKKASPSAGLIREDFDPVAIAEAYHGVGASCLSVLTDREFFRGDLAYIELAKAAVPIPVLRKDFIIDPYQLYESRAAGADAILLIAEVLTVEEITSLLMLADAMGMTTLIEAHSPDRLLEAKAAAESVRPKRYLLGINNRDLTRQITDVSTTERLARLLDDTSNLVTESGIKTRQDVERVRDAGAAAMLVGETLMASPDIAAKARELLGVPA